MEAKREYDIPVLSGSVHVGQLYDAKTDQLLYDRYLWKDPIAVKEANITSIETDTYIEETVRNRISHMSVNAKLTLSLLFGLIKVWFDRHCQNNLYHLIILQFILG